MHSEAGGATASARLSRYNLPCPGHPILAQTGQCASRTIRREARVRGLKYSKIGQGPRTPPEMAANAVLAPTPSPQKQQPRPLPGRDPFRDTSDCSGRALALRWDSMANNVSIDLFATGAWPAGVLEAPAAFAM